MHRAHRVGAVGTGSGRIGIRSRSVSVGGRHIGVGSSGIRVSSAGIGRAGVVALCVGILRCGRALRSSRGRGDGCARSHADRSAHGDGARSRTAVVAPCSVVAHGRWRMIRIVRCGWMIVRVSRRMVGSCRTVGVRVSRAVASLARRGAAIGVGVARAPVVVMRSAAAVLVGVRRALTVGV